MGHEGTKIIGIVNILADLQPVLGTTLGSIQDIVAGKNSAGQYIVNINKWALYKPIIAAAPNFANPTERQNAIAAAHAGFGTSGQKSCPKLLRQSYFKQSDGVTSYTEAECLAEVMEWGPYIRPAGTIGQQPFRIQDFQNYEHAAVAPDRWLNKTFTQAQISSIASSNVSYTGARGSHVFSPAVGGLHEGVRCAITAESSGRISPDAYMEIPIATITGALVENNDWRFAVAVWLSSRNEWAIFPSRKNIYTCIREGGVSANIFPDFGCNPSACKVILSEFNGGRRTWDMVPIFVQNIGVTVDSDGKNVPCLVVGASLVYCMPSGTKTLSLEVQSSRQKKFFTLRSTQGSTATNRNWFLKNTDTSAYHVYTVKRTVRQTSTITSETYTDTGVAANTEISLGTNVPYDIYGTNVLLEIIARDGIPVEELED